MAYASTGIGAGIAFVAYPFIYNAIRQNNSYHYTILYMTIFVATSFLAPLTFEPRIKEVKPESLLNLLKDYFKSLKNVPSTVNMVNNFFWNGGHVGVLALLFGHISRNHGPEIATVTQTIFGCFGVAGSLTITLILMKLRLNHYILQILCNMLMALACLTIAISRGIAVVGYAMASMMGFLHLVTISNKPCMCVHLLPPASVEIAFGFTQVFGAAGSLSIPALAGYIDATYGDLPAFIFLASVIFMAALTLILPVIVKRSMWRSFKDKENEKDESRVEEKSEPTKSSDLTNDNGGFVADPC